MTDGSPNQAGPTLIGRFRSVAEAEAARGALVSAGINAFIADENVVAINWLYSNAVGGVRLFVASEDAEAAKQLLAGGGEFLPQESQPAVSAAHLGCSECGSPAVGRIPKLTIFGAVLVLSVVVAYATEFSEFALLLMIIVTLILVISPTHKCRDCGHVWSPPPADPDPGTPVPDEVEPADIVCPRCGSVETERIRRRRAKGVTLALTFIGVFLWLPILLAWPFLNRWQCSACGNRF